MLEIHSKVNPISPNMQNSVILFYSTNYAIWASEVLKTKNIENKMIPVPRELSSDCGYCVKIKNGDNTKVEKILKDNNIEYDRIAHI